MTTPIAPIVLVLVSCVALVCLFRLAKGRTLTAGQLNNQSEHLKSVDVEAFRNLIDPAEEEFLRLHLAPVEFRRIQRERLRAAVDYVVAVATNAAILLRVGEGARLNSNPETAASAQNLMDTALRLRLYALQALVVLYLGILLPGRRISVLRVAERYEQMTRQVIMFGLQYPLHGVSAAL
jgi:hypothetical protein